MTTKKQIGNRIRVLRAAHKMTQEQFAIQLQVSPATVSGWEIGDIGLSIDAAIRLVNFCDVSLDWLLKGNNSEAAGCPDAATPEEARLLVAFRNLGKVSQAAILRITEGLAK